MCVFMCVCILLNVMQLADKLQFDATLDRPLTFLEQMEREKDTTQSSLDTSKAPGTGDVCVCVYVYTHTHTHTQQDISKNPGKAYICVNMLLYMSVCYYICVLKALRILLRPQAQVKCVLILRYMCPHTHVCVLILKRERRHSGYYN